MCRLRLFLSIKIRVQFYVGFKKIQNATSLCHFGIMAGSHTVDELDVMVIKTLVILYKLYKLRCYLFYTYSQHSILNKVFFCVSNSCVTEGKKKIYIFIQNVFHNF